MAQALEEQERRQQEASVVDRDTGGTQGPALLESAQGQPGYGGGLTIAGNIKWSSSDNNPHDLGPGQHSQMGQMGFVFLVFVFKGRIFYG